MVLRLLDLQRKRTAEQRLVDLRTRRTLHDDILPALHLAVLQLHGAGSHQPTVEATLATLAEVHKQIAGLLTSTQPSPAGAAGPCELVTALRSLVATEFVHSFDRIEWQGLANGDLTGQERTAGTVYIDPVVGEVVLGAARETIRNAASHARGNKPDRPLSLQIHLCAPRGHGDDLTLTIADNGIGAGNSSATPSPFPGGSRSGLALHSTLLALVGGQLNLTSPPEGGTQVTIAVPSSF
jgi:hypothetical protein